MNSICNTIFARAPIILYTLNNNRFSNKKCECWPPYRHPNYTTNSGAIVPVIVILLFRETIVQICNLWLLRLNSKMDRNMYV